MQPLPEMVFLGYRVKRPWDPGPDWAPIKLICNVGEDLCEPPEDWVSRWDFNLAFCYATPEEAWSTVEGDVSPYRLFAYYLVPLSLEDKSESRAVSVGDVFPDEFALLPPSPVEPLDMDVLGYDIAEHNAGFLGYAYSPLVTNGFSNEFPTNRYGLLEELKTAIRACERINALMPEHAPHWIFKVLAKGVDDLLPRIVLS